MEQLEHCCRYKMKAEKYTKPTAFIPTGKNQVKNIMGNYPTKAAIKPMQIRKNESNRIHPRPLKENYSIPLKGVFGDHMKRRPR